MLQFTGTIFLNFLHCLIFLKSLWMMEIGTLGSLLSVHWYAGPMDFKGRFESAQQCWIVPTKRTQPDIFSAGVESPAQAGLNNSGPHAGGCSSAAWQSSIPGVNFSRRCGEWQPCLPRERSRLGVLWEGGLDTKYRLPRDVRPISIIHGNPATCSLG